MNNLFLLLLLFAQFSSVLFAVDVKPCFVIDPVKHESNQILLNTVLEEELAYCASKKTPKEKAAYLSARISQIADIMLQNGFSTEAYGVPELDQNSIVSFNCFALWEGDKNSKEKIPLTFFIYIWPSEELALKYNSENPQNRRYGSNIHSHPIPCSFAVLQGTLFQNNYELVSSRFRESKVRFINQEIFQEGEGDVDDLKKPFIHKLYSKGSGTKPSLSLHSYGLSSEEKVMECFDKNFFKHSYRL